MFNIYMTTLNKKDSIGNIVKLNSDFLEKLHLESRVYCYKNKRRDVKNSCTGLSFLKPLFFSSKNDFHWFHYPHYYELLGLIKYVRGKKIVEYHGVTPPKLWKDNKTILSVIQAENKRRIINNADLIITHSKFTYKELKKDLDKKIPHLVVPIPTDLDKFKTRKVDKEKYYEKYGIKPKYKLLITVGRLAYHKRLPVQIRALKNVPGAKLLIVGNNKESAHVNEYKKCVGLVKKLGLEKRVVFTGPVNDKELVDLYNLASIYLCSSLHEGFCMPIIEAMACGTPVIGANNAAIPETMNGSGILFEPNNHHDLSNKINKLLKDKKLYERLVRKGLRNSRIKNLDEKKFQKILKKLS